MEQKCKAERIGHMSVMQAEFILKAKGLS